MLFKDFVNNYYLQSISGLAESTQIGYKSSINKYILPYWGNIDLNDIKTQEIEKWLLTIEKPGAAEKAYKTFRQIIHKAKDYNILTIEDPTRKRIKVPKKKGYQPKLLTADEVNQLLNGFKGHYLEPTVICAVMLGLRRGEAFALKWEDIDLETGKVIINKTYQQINGHPQYLPTKTIKSTRTCWLPHSILNRMRELGQNKNGRICPIESPHKMAKDYRDYCFEYNLPYTSFTNLRHTWATLALETGTDISVVANMLGHTDISTAYNHYLKPRESTYQQTQDNVASIVSLGKNFQRSEKWESWMNKIKNLVKKT